MSKELTEEGVEIGLDDARANIAPTAESGTTNESGARRLLRFLGVLVSPLYGLGARRGRRRGMAARDARGRPACAVVSVGGMTVGGAGKDACCGASCTRLRKTRISYGAREPWLSRPRG